ncbi:MAG TPA: metalloregulator ArsR/SmtB family transcription factor [Aggregatilineaceae bacterium]|nr:metalloregulator ArsR/SmtB family transcription factor [Aggregatilineaceae bacterium]
MSNRDLDARAALFKALGHPIRLLILSLIRLQPRHGEELAAILSLDPATISHHLTKLVEAGLLQSAKDQYYQTYSLSGALLNRTLAEIALLPQPALVPTVALDAYRAQVLDAFFTQGRLTHLPAQVKKQRIVLEKIAEDFDPHRDYTEREVNQILVDYHDDVAALRRALIDHGLFTRTQGIYHRQ